MHCKEICFRYIVKSLVPKEIGPYEFGLKRCSSCETYLCWNGNQCPCCGHFLRTKPRNTKSRDKLTQKNILKKFQSKLNLTKETIDFSQKLYDELREKDSFKNQPTHHIMAICIFLAARFKGQQKSLKQISKTFQINEVDLEMCCEMALDEIKPILLCSN